VPDDGDKQDKDDQDRRDKDDCVWMEDEHGGGGGDGVKTKPPSGKTNPMAALG